MRIHRISRQHRRDFTADMICEHCKHIQKDVSCYDDTYFHTTVIPKMKCKQCGKEAAENYVPLAPKYNDSMIL